MESDVGNMGQHLISRLFLLRLYSELILSRFEDEERCLLDGVGVDRINPSKCCGSVLRDSYSQASSSFILPKKLENHLENNPGELRGTPEEYSRACEIVMSSRFHVK